MQSVPAGRPGFYFVICFLYSDSRRTLSTLFAPWIDLLDFDRFFYNTWTWFTLMMIGICLPIGLFPGFELLLVSFCL